MKDVRQFRVRNIWKDGEPTVTYIFSFPKEKNEDLEIRIPLLDVRLKRLKKRKDFILPFNQFVVRMLQG